MVHLFDTVTLELMRAFLRSLDLQKSSRIHPQMQGRNLIFGVILRLNISYQKFVTTPPDISQILVQNLTKAAREAGVSHSFLSSSI